MNTALQDRPALTPRNQAAVDIAMKFTKPNGQIDWNAAFVENPKAKQLLAPNPSTVVYDLRARGVLPEKKKLTGKKIGRPTIRSAAARKRWKLKKAKMNGHDNGEAVIKESKITPKVQRMIDRQVGERVAAILRENCYCGRCGKNLEAQLIASSFSTTYQPHQ